MKLQTECYGSLLCRQTPLMWAHPPIKRDDDASSGNTVLVVPIIVAIIFLTVFIPLFIIMYRVWRVERADKLRKQSVMVKEDGSRGFDKAELPGESLVTLHEMDSAHAAQEMPETKDGLCHEMLGATIQPQELPAALHEMPAEDHEKMVDEEENNSKSTSNIEME
ncbi:hypothetical protein O1611_g7371 [Lasiodiplodia mahajangana]|uniref:Uncharacterized protein n=1 Tax=Lasiodiplodia mahajangana TaxID=1108764 RepID=A0ACC2JFN4_9PEZI|nr:hypothetical protein O1611_g7371 [Lasiodiplodia mahajangana]